MTTNEAVIKALRYWMTDKEIEAGIKSAKRRIKLESRRLNGIKG